MSLQCVDLELLVINSKATTSLQCVNLGLSRFQSCINMIFFSDLKAGKSSGAVETRLLRYWEARNVKRGGELMWMDMLLIDVNSTVIQASISPHRLSKYQERLAAGKMFSLSGFDVVRSAQNYKLSDCALQIRFSDSTVFDEITEPVSPLPEEGFRFRNQSELIGLANTNSHLIGNL